MDYTINDRNSLSAHWFAGQGNQVAPVGSSLKYYYEVAPIHVQNYALVYNHVFAPSITNQLLAGVNYFNQVFNDFNNSFDVATLGLVTGSSLPGAPNIQITGFDPVGETPPEGRNDITGHLTEDLAWTVGKHQFKFGGEFRQAQLDEFYHRHALGSFSFDGSQGPGSSSDPWAWNCRIRRRQRSSGQRARRFSGRRCSHFIDCAWRPGPPGLRKHLRRFRAGFLAGQREAQCQLWDSLGLRRSFAQLGERPVGFPAQSGRCGVPGSADRLTVRSDLAEFQSSRRIVLAGSAKDRRTRRRSASTLTRRT